MAYIRTTITLLLFFPFFVVMIYIVMLIIKALRKYLASSEEGTSTDKKTLGEAIKEKRIKCKMTQEFVAESVGVSVVAVSKWESDELEPSVSKLFELTKLFGISIGELLKEVVE